MYLPADRQQDEELLVSFEQCQHAEAIDTLVDLMRHGKDERVRGTAAQALLDRGWGKAKVEVVTGAESSYLELLQAVNDQIKQEPRLS
ncbi:HEAT repeat domain-containing protein [Alphaproteobacteria bacterium]|nr:HEAT repeat domain-containing protein [Alphaproteobacteria bacterium]